MLECDDCITAGIGRAVPDMVFLEREHQGETLLQKGYPPVPFPKTLKWLAVTPPVSLVWTKETRSGFHDLSLARNPGGHGRPGSCWH